MMYNYVVLCGVCYGRPITTCKDRRECPQCNDAGTYITSRPLPGQIIYDRFVVDTFGPPSIRFQRIS